MTVVPGSSPRAVASLHARLDFCADEYSPEASLEAVSRHGADLPAAAQTE